jgi:type I restriction enzyme S subunit
MSNLGDVMSQRVCIPDSVPDDWAWCNLIDICKPKQWKTISASEMTTTGYPVFGANGFVGFYSKYNHEFEAIAITCRGNTCGTINRIPKKTYVTGNSMALNDIKSDRIEQDFLFYALSYRSVTDSISGSAQPQITGSNLKQISFPMPPLPEQQKIAAILTAVDEVIEKTQAQIDKLKDLKTAMMQELLTKGIGHVEFKDSPVGRIPVGWEVKTLGHISSLQRGHDLTRAQMVDGPYPIVSSSGFNGMNHEYTTKGPGVVVGRKGSIGRVHFLESDYWAHDTSLYVTNFFGNNVRYVYYLFLYMDLQQYGTKSGSPSLNRNDIHPLKVALPTIDEQQKIQAILSNIDMSISLLTNKKEKINNTKKALMQDLLTGKVRVNTGLSNSSLAVG